VKKTLPILLVVVPLLLAAGCNSLWRTFFFTPPQKPVDMIYDDDCDGDIDCAVTQPIIHHWINIGYVKLWGMVSSGPSQLGAPTMKVFQHYYGHDDLFSIGAWTPICGLHASATWNIAVIGKFDPGDVCTNYENCSTVLRQSVARYIAGGGKTNGLAYVITGPLSCEEAFRATPADAISLLTGAQMEQQFISQFVLMNGCSASPSLFNCTLENNCEVDINACSAFFANATSQNGYPPVYVVPLNTGAANVYTQVPIASLPLSNPTAFAYASIGRNSTADEDPLTVEFAVFGSTGWTLSANSTNTVSTATDENIWSSSKASGQYSLSTATSPVSFEALLANPWFATNNFE
jgi:hypothetical protein